MVSAVKLWTIDLFMDFFVRSVVDSIPLPFVPLTVYNTDAQSCDVKTIDYRLLTMDFLDAQQ